MATAQLIKCHTVSIYGMHSISKGSYTWTIQCKAKHGMINVGIIEDEPGTLERSKVNFKQNGKYFTTSVKECTKVEVTVDMDNHTLCYQIRGYYGYSCGMVTDELEETKYRLFISLGIFGAIVEFQ